MKFAILLMAAWLNFAFGEILAQDIRAVFEKFNEKNFNELKAYSQKIGEKRYEIFLLSHKNFNSHEQTNSDLTCATIASEGQIKGSFCLNGIKNFSSFTLEEEEHEALLLYLDAKISDEILNLSLEFTPKDSGFMLSQFFANDEALGFGASIDINDMSSELLREILSAELSKDDKDELFDNKISPVRLNQQTTTEKNLLKAQSLSQTIEAFKDFKFDGAFSSDFELNGVSYELVQLYKDRFWGENGVYDKMDTKICAALFKNGSLFGKFCHSQTIEPQALKYPPHIATKESFFTIENAWKYDQTGVETYTTFKSAQDGVFLHQFSAVLGSGDKKQSRIYYRSDKNGKIFLKTGQILDLDKLKKGRANSLPARF